MGYLKKKKIAFIQTAFLWFMQFVVFIVFILFLWLYGSVLKMGFAQNVFFMNILFIKLILCLVSFVALSWMYCE